MSHPENIHRRGPCTPATAEPGRREAMRKIPARRPLTTHVRTEVDTVAGYVLSRLVLEDAAPAADATDGVRQAS